MQAERLRLHKKYIMTGLRKSITKGLQIMRKGYKKALIRTQKRTNAF